MDTHTRATSVTSVTGISVRSHHGASDVVCTPQAPSEEDENALRPSPNHAAVTIDDPVRACLGAAARERRRSYSMDEPSTRRRAFAKFAPLWRRSGSAHSSAASKPDERSLADRARSAPPLARMRKAFFERPDTRVAEDLRSTKRRIIQISRQSDHAPVQCALGFRSRTGWEPIRAVRENQDCIVAKLPWGPQGQYSLFGAFDGHGRAGHLCCMFVAQRIITYLLRALKHSKPDVAAALHRSFEYAEQRLQSVTSTMDCTVSGSTGCLVLLDGAMLYCANVGDSRAVLGRKRSVAPHSDHRQTFANNPNFASNSHFVLNPPTPNSYDAIPLSFDQKATRADEKERVIAAGGRVDAWKGCDVGAERVWLPDSRTPGLAVTRSFGDFIVKDYGVTATPEIYSLPLCSNDSFVVIASDGVYEFMSNEEVTEIAARHRDIGSPQTAAEEIVKLSADRWIEDDSAIDDISCVVVFLDVKFPISDGNSEPQRVEVDSRNISAINTPVSSRMNSFRPTSSNSKMLFGQYSQNSAASRTVSGNTRNPIVLPRPDLGIVASDSQSGGVMLNDTGRRYIQKLKFEAKRTSNESVGATNVPKTFFKVDSATEIGSDVFCQPPQCSSVTPSSVELAPSPPVHRKLPDGSSDVEMFEESSAFEGDVSGSSERFEDAEEEFVDMDITTAGDGCAVASYGAPALSSTSAAAAAAAVASLGSNGALANETDETLSPIKIDPSDDENGEKYADADALVPIDNHHKVVRAREVSAHRRRLVHPATPLPRRPFDAVRKKRNPLQSAAESMDRRLAALTESLETSSPASSARTPTDNLFRFGRRPRRAARDAYDGAEPAGSGRLRRLLSKQRPRSSISADGF